MSHNSGSIIGDVKWREIGCGPKQRSSLADRKTVQFTQMKDRVDYGSTYHLVDLPEIGQIQSQ